MHYRALAGVVTLLACGGPQAHTPAPAAGDADRDRIVGAADRCPAAVETYNGFEDEDGCPDRPPADRAHCDSPQRDQIVDQLFFDDDSTQLPARARPLLDAIAATLNANSQLERIGVVGGRASGERDALATERALAITASLVELGVERDRLEPHGLVRDPGADRARDRAVWFVILRRTGATAPTSEARWLPWQLDCAASWAAWRRRGSPIDCACLESRH